MPFGLVNEALLIKGLVPFSRRKRSLKSDTTLADNNVLIPNFPDGNCQKAERYHRPAIAFPITGGETEIESVTVMGHDCLCIF